MPATALRPRSATEIIDASFQLLRRHYTQLVAVAVVALLPYIVLVAVTGGTGSGSPAAILVVLAQYLCAALAEAAVIVGVSEAYLEGSVDIHHAIVSTAGRLPPSSWPAFSRGSRCWWHAGVCLPRHLRAVAHLRDHPGGGARGEVRRRVVPALVGSRQGEGGGRSFVTLLLAWLIFSSSTSCWRDPRDAPLAERTGLLPGGALLLAPLPNRAGDPALYRIRVRRGSNRVWPQAPPGPT